MTNPTGTDRPRIFVHVGSPKTGTTFLQNVLWSQREQAAQQGLLLPMERFFDHYLASLDVREVTARHNQPRAIGMWQRLVDEATSWSGTVLISHELFAAATAEQASRAIASFGDHEVHLLLTARDLVRQVPAEWQEHVKHRSTMTLTQFVRELEQDHDHKNWFWQVQDFADIIGRWGRLLPPERVHVVTVPPRSAPADTLWNRFATLLGLDPASFDLTAGRDNSSLGLEQAELLRRVNSQLGARLPLPGPYPRVVKSIFAQRVLAGRPGRRIALDRATAGFALERSAEIADRLRGLGVDVVGDLVELVPDEEATLAEARSIEDVPDAELVEESTAALAELLVLLGDNRERQRYEELTRQLRERPVRFALLRASERRPALARARRAFVRGRGLTRRLGSALRPHHGA